VVDYKAKVDMSPEMAAMTAQFCATVTGHPVLSDFSVKQFDVMADETAITRGPV
jgi:roadblock/LC7 domain-containing protein